MLSGFRFEVPLVWRFNLETVPDEYDPEAVLEVAQRAFSNVTDARNLCGRPDAIGAQSEYIGPTRLVPCEAETITRTYSVVGFGPRQPGDPADVLAYVCPYGSGDDIDVVDIVIVEGRWALTDEPCRRQDILESVLTHEVGHAFGLDHVNGRQHRHLTMRPRSDYCEPWDSTLGLGDLLGLEQLYPVDD